MPLEGTRGGITIVINDLDVQDEGVDLGATKTLNFVGSAVSVSESNGVATVTITGGGTGSGTVESVSVVSANGFKGIVASATTTPKITIDVSALPTSKIAGGAFGRSFFATATTAAAQSLLNQTSGTVTTLSVASANGFTGSVLNPTTTPVITINASAIPTSKIAGGAFGRLFFATTTTAAAQNMLEAGTVGLTIFKAATTAAVQNIIDASAKQNILIFQDEGSALATAGTITTINFTGAAVDVSANSSTLTVRCSAAGGGSGDVVGPASSTDNAIVRFDSTTGKLIQDSAILISDSGDLIPVGVQTLGSAAKPWNGLFIASAATIDFGNGDVTIANTQTNQLSFAGASTAYTFGNGGALRPASNDGSPLGTATISWADLFLATGGVINWANGNVTITHATSALTVKAETFNITGNAAITGTVSATSFNSVALTNNGSAAKFLNEAGVYVEVSAANINAGAFGRQMLATATTAAAQAALGATAVGIQLLQAATTTAATNALGGGTVGVQIFQAVTTAAVQSLTDLPTASSTTTFTNKRITKRMVTANAPGATPTTNTDNCDIATFTGLATAITSMTTNLSGTPIAGADFIEFQFVDNGTPRAITWGASFAATTVALPTTTVTSTLLRVLFQRNLAGTVWDCVAVA